MPLAAAGICAAGMAVLVAGIALALGTTGHDWYAAWKYTLAEAMLTVGFSDYGLVDYRTADGRTVTVERYRLAHVMNEAWSARRMIFSLAADRAVLGRVHRACPVRDMDGGAGGGAPAPVRGRARRVRGAGTAGPARICGPDAPPGPLDRRRTDRGAGPPEAAELTVLAGVSGRNAERLAGARRRRRAARNAA